MISIIDLMFGDWVDAEGYGQVKGLFIDKEDHCPQVLIRDEVWYPFNLIEPIPLTPEILEKNGFEKNKFVKSFSEYVLKKGESEIIVARGEIEEMWIRRTLAERAYCLPYPKYVHELQHALRLCGIDLDIKL